ncbi:hypothetical protein MKQ68_03135 [Chitinophaga horti]|uniref:Uncharacterized protein n=1 Tax=Chitinophaga horti TaxID=2920382 RepID=A0ABY6J339_9BACT|nr:hypothetical protein [Chitinophaga horti]UYQ94084.1 hypothetical protein MKQ68_03135 [Chitinophaga horti]
MRTPWSLSIIEYLKREEQEVLIGRRVRNMELQVLNSGEALLASIKLGKSHLCCAMAYAPGGGLQLKRMLEEGDRYVFFLSSPIGDMKVTLEVTDEEQQLLHYNCELTPAAPLFIPFWPRDVHVLDERGDGTVHVKQVGARSGVTFATMSRPELLCICYQQDLSMLGAYCEEIGVPAQNAVGGDWPEFGFSLPPTKEKPLPPDKQFVISDAYLLIDQQPVLQEFDLAREYLRAIARIYLHIARPETKMHDWPLIVKRSLLGLEHHHGCWNFVSRNFYLTPYVGDYSGAPEIMVQLAVLMPLHDYRKWSGEPLALIDSLEKGIGDFYDERLRTIIRWLPAAEDRLTGDEEQKKPRVMDAWYLHHPLLNLSRMAKMGNKSAERLFIGSLDYVIKVAHHFKYHWPVFYNVDTLEVIKAETAPGKGGEKDVAGIYAHIMLQAWELTGDKRYLREAEKAAITLTDFGFDMFYQANNTAFSAGAMLRLYKVTGKKRFLDLSYLCIANLFKNMRLWNCNYGHGKHYPTFFALYPLNDAPYTAVYEEQEGFAAIHDFLQQAEGVDIMPAVSLLLAEYVRFLIYRAAYYFPVMLPEEVLVPKPKAGELDKELWVAIEDLHDGFEQSGSVGQEVYGAGLAFGIVPRHYLKLPNETFTIFIDYPTTGFDAGKGRSVKFGVKGYKLLKCRLAIIKTSAAPLPEFKVRGSDQGLITGGLNSDGHLCFDVQGDQEITINWTKN